jgi:hypothetical protein
VTTANENTRHFWERNLRSMTNSSKDGPESGAPAIMPAGMLGDRAAAIFAATEEITKMIEARCRIVPAFCERSGLEALVVLTPLCPALQVQTSGEFDGFL